MLHELIGILSYNTTQKPYINYYILITIFFSSGTFLKTGLQQGKKYSENIFNSYQFWSFTYEKFMQYKIKGYLK